MKDILEKIVENELSVKIGYETIRDNRRAILITVSGKRPDVKDIGYYFGIEELMDDFEGCIRQAIEAYLNYEIEPDD